MMDHESDYNARGAHVTMKALVLEDYNRLAFKDVPRPMPDDNEVLVEVKAAGICGSDVHGMDGSTGRRIPPVIMGHEASGIISFTGKKVTGWRTGDRVTFDSTIYNPDDWYSRKGHYNLSDGRMVLGVSCREFRREGAFAQYVVVPQHILYSLPDNVSFEQAAVVEPVAVALHAVNISGITIGSSAVVNGSGVIGLCLVQLLKLSGCKVIATDLLPEKLEMAKKAGADFVFEAQSNDLQAAIRQITDGRGADYAFDAVGISTTVRQAIGYLRKGSALILIGNLSPVADLPLQEVVTREITIKGSCAINGEYPVVLDLISGGKIKVEGLVSAVAPLSEGALYFNRLYNKEKGLLKVILKP